MDVDDFFLTLNVLPPSAMVPQVNVPPNVSSAKIDWSSFEGLYPSIEGGSSSSSSAPASQLAIENVNRTLQALTDTVMESRGATKRDTGEESAEATAKAKAKATPKKQKAPAIEDAGETGGTSIFVASPETAGTGSASSSKGPTLPKPKAKATSSSSSSSGVKKTIEKDASPKTPKLHGTKIERLTERKLRDKNLGYLVDQMQARGKKFLASELKGKTKLTKNQLAEMILKWDAENAAKPA